MTDDLHHISPPAPQGEEPELRSQHHTGRKASSHYRPKSSTCRKTRRLPPLHQPPSHQIAIRNPPVTFPGRSKFVALIFNAAPRESTRRSPRQPPRSEQPPLPAPTDKKSFSIRVVRAIGGSPLNPPQTQNSSPFAHTPRTCVPCPSCRSQGCIGASPPPQNNAGNSRSRHFLASQNRASAPAGSR